MKIENTDIYKIGYSTMHPKKRLYVIKYFLKKNLILIDYVFCDFKYEGILHSQCKDKQTTFNYNFLNYKNIPKTYNFKEFFKLSEIDVSDILDLFFKLKTPNPA